MPSMSGSIGASDGSSSSDVRPIRSRNRSVVRNRPPPVSGSVPDLDDQPAREQGAHDAVDVDPADRRHPRPGDRLPVGDDGERLQRRLAEPAALAVPEELLDDLGVRRPGVDAHAAGDLAQLDAGVALVVGLAQRRQRLLDRGSR